MYGDHGEDGRSGESRRLRDETTMGWLILRRWDRKGKRRRQKQRGEGAYLAYMNHATVLDAIASRRTRLAVVRRAPAGRRGKCGAFERCRDGNALGAAPGVSQGREVID